MAFCNAPSMNSMEAYIRFEKGLISDDGDVTSAFPSDGEQGLAGHGTTSANRDGHDKHAGHCPAMFRDKCWLSLILTVPVVVWARHIQALLAYQAPTFPGSAWIPRYSAPPSFSTGGWYSCEAPGRN